MKKIVILVLMFALVSSVSAQKPPKRSFWRKIGHHLILPFQDNKLMMAMGIQGAAMAADGWTTSKVQNTCPICVERNSLFLGRRPSDRRISLVLGIAWYAQAQLVKWEKDEALRFAKDSDSKPGQMFWSTVWLTHPTVLTTAHTWAAKHNSRLFCPSGMKRLTPNSCRF